MRATISLPSGLHSSQDGSDTVVDRYAFELWLSRDDGVTFDRENAAVVYNPGRRITGRGWPRTVQLDDETVGTLFYDLTEAPEQPGGPSLWFKTTKIAAMLGK